MNDCGGKAIALWLVLYTKKLDVWPSRLYWRAWWAEATQDYNKEKP